MVSKSGLKTRLPMSVQFNSYVFLNSTTYNEINKKVTHSKENLNLNIQT